MWTMFYNLINIRNSETSLLHSLIPDTALASFTTEPATSTHAPPPHSPVELLQDILAVLE